MKGDLSLLGADVVIVEGNQLNVILRTDNKGSNMHLKAKSNKEANEWHAAIVKQIRFQNTLALHKQSRLAEVVEWYYQLQAELNRKHAFLLKNIEVYINFGSSSSSRKEVSIFHVAVSISKVYH
jgi:hypothetical protein